MNGHTARRCLGLTAVAAFALLGPLATAASAATLSSPPVLLRGGNIIECVITNVTATALNVTVKLLDNDVVLGNIPTIVGAQKSTGISGNCASPFCNVPRCQFVTSSPASSFRAIACVRPADNTSASTDGKVCQEAR